MKKNNRPLIIIILVFILELAVIGVLGVTCLKRVNSIEQKNNLVNLRHQLSSTVTFFDHNNAPLGR